MGCPWGSCRETGTELHKLSEKAGKVQKIIEADTPESRSCRLSEMIRRKSKAIPETSAGLDLSIKTSRTRDIWISDGILLEIAIKEVIENALEHNDDPDPSVSIGVSVSPSDAVEISITDNGPGIPHYEKRVIQSGEETPLLHGSGLGLWLVYWIMTVIGGTLEIESNHPRGTIVRLSIPIDGERVYVTRVGEEADD